MTKRICLWAPPRSMSTAFECSIRQLPGVKVLFEPLHEAYFYGPERCSDVYLLKEPHRYNPDATYARAKAVLAADYGGYDAVFAKDMVYFLQEHFKEMITEPMSKYKHTFLIRSPRKAIPSLRRACDRIGQSSRLSVTFAAFPALYDLYRTVQQVDPNPVVIDADDLLENPREIMKLYCASTGLPFHDNMLSWTPGFAPEWTKWRDHEVWHGQVAESTCFERKPNPNNSETFSPDVEEIIRLSMPYYETMFNSRLKLL